MKAKEKTDQNPRTEPKVNLEAVEEGLNVRPWKIRTLDDRARIKCGTYVAG